MLTNRSAVGPEVSTCSRPVVSPKTTSFSIIIRFTAGPKDAASSRAMPMSAKMSSWR
ncbi:Uncharacterised protein [Mycobacteroides abscessus subsp. abscessus]|nr:Uncharacterised protein [Mycobacteroides abscessus subsp. abscessus]